MNKKFIIVIYSILIIVCFISFFLVEIRTTVNLKIEEDESKVLDICIVKDDLLEPEIFENFIWEGTKYIAKIRDVELSQIDNCNNILVTEGFIFRNKKARKVLKNALDNNSKLVIETDKEPFVILSLLGIDIKEVVPTDIFPKCNDIGAVGIYRENLKYVVGFAKLNLVTKHSRDYYNTLLRGFLPN